MDQSGLSSRAIIGRFYQTLEAVLGASWVSRISTLFQSDQESETYKWLGLSPALREWIGGRNPKGLRENGITIDNKKYEATLEIDVDDLRRDKTGQILVRVDELADRVNEHWAKLLSTLLINAESTVCYDGQYFFDTDHSEGNSGTQDNDLSVDISELPVGTGFHGSITAPSPEELEQAILQGVQAILGFKDDQGEPMNAMAKEFLVMVPVPFLKAALAACKNPVLAGGKTNTIANNQAEFTITPVANPRLTWTTKLAVFRTDGRAKPLIRQEEQELEVTAIAEGSEEEFKHNRHLYGVKTLRNVGYGYWSHTCLVTLA